MEDRLILYEKISLITKGLAIFGGLLLAYFGPPMNFLDKYVQWGFTAKEKILRYLFSWLGIFFVLSVFIWDIILYFIKK